MIEEVAQSNENQAIKTHGGARPGAGRKPGSTNKLKIADFFTPTEIDQLVLEAKMLAFGDGERKPDKDMIKFITEQIFGKAMQKTITEDEQGNRLAPILVKILKDGSGNSN
jgi:hypothetical protein